MSVAVLNDLRVQEWKQVEFGDIVEIQNGFAFKSKDYTNAGHFVMRIGNVQDGYISLDNPKFIHPSAKEERFALNAKDILVSLTGNIGRAGMIMQNHLPAVLNQRVARVTPKNHRCLDSSFLFHYLASSAFRDGLSDGGHGAAQQNVSTKDMAALPFFLPPLPEQERIVGILDEAFEGIATATAHAERNLQNARQLFQSVLQSTFQQKGEDWVRSDLSSLCTIKHGFAFKGEFFDSKGDFVCLTPGNFFEEGGYRDRGNKTKFYNGEIPKDYVLTEGDFLFAMTEQAVGLLGSSLIVPESNRFLHNQRLGLVQLQEGVDWDNGFFFHQFNTREFRDAVQSSASGVKVRHTSPKKLGAIEVVVPPLKTQKAIVKKLDALSTETRRLEALYQRKLAVLAELKQSLLQRAFAGEL